MIYIDNIFLEVVQTATLFDSEDLRT